MTLLLVYQRVSPQRPFPISLRQRLAGQTIKHCKAAVILVTEGSLDRCLAASPTCDGDWMRREVGCALAHQKLVVPVLTEGQRMPKRELLPQDIAVGAAMIPSGPRWKCPALHVWTPSPPRTRRPMH